MASTMTNTVHVAFQGSMSAAATELRLHRFGEILSVTPVQDEPGKVAVAFFDVRAAGRAASALGCEFGPQTGSRSTALAGDAFFDEDDVEAISGATAADGGAYVFEFFDIRVAARYSGGKALDLGSTDDCRGAVSAPPGLGHPSVADDAQCPSRTHEVCIAGVPWKLLTQAFMEAILEQAGFGEEVVGLSTRVCKPCGEAVVGFASATIAARCAAHFQGCVWSEAGKGVTAKVISVGASDNAPSTLAKPKLSAAAPAFKPMRSDPLPVETGGAWYSSEASTPTTDAETPCSRMSAAAPEFVPGAEGGSKAKVKVIGAVSDTSTEVSESEDEKDSRWPMFVVASSKKGMPSLVKIFHA